MLKCLVIYDKKPKLTGFLCVVYWR